RGSNDGPVAATCKLLLSRDLVGCIAIAGCLERAPLGERADARQWASFCGSDVAAFCPILACIRTPQFTVSAVALRRGAQERLGPDAVRVHRLRNCDSDYCGVAMVDRWARITLGFAASNGAGLSSPSCLMHRHGCGDAGIACFRPDLLAEPVNVDRSGRVAGP